MEAGIISKVNELAMSLKKNHLVATMEEAVAKAREILGVEDDFGLKQEAKSIKELLEEEEKAGKDAKKGLEEAGQLKAEVLKKVSEDEKEIAESKEIAGEIKEGAEEAADDLEAARLAEDGEEDENQEEE